jgi:hypothetical protein
VAQDRWLSFSGLRRKGNALPTVALLPLPYEFRDVQTSSMSRTAGAVATAAEVSHSVITRRIVVTTGTTGGNSFQFKFTSHRVPVPFVLIGSLTPY